MKNKKTLFQFVDKLKEINVNEVIERSKNISIDDLKSISWEDIKSSKFTKPIIGISLSIAFIFIFLIPELKKYNHVKIKSTEYSTKKQNLEDLNLSLNKSKLIKSILDANLEEFKLLTADKSKLINITDLISDAAKRSLVEISEFNPITNDEVSSCAATANDESEDFENFDLSTSEDQSLGSDEPPPDDFGLDESFDEFSDGSSDTIESVLLSLQKKLDYISDNDNYIFSLSPEISSSSIPKSIDEEFESNFYKLTVRGDFINMLNLLRSMQEYKITILPLCFEPSLISQSANQGSAPFSIQPGYVNARLIINIPTTK